MRLKITSSLLLGCLLLFIACGGGGGGSDGSSGVAVPADFIMEVPIETTQYVNRDDPTDMAWYDSLFIKKAYADTILQVSPMANNIIQDWWTGDCATLYDEADPANIRLLPLIGDRKKLVVGEQYQLIVEADRLNQFNQCGLGYAVTGGWTFTIASVTVGEIDDNVVIVDQYETGELVIEIVDNGTDYSTAPVVTINFAGDDYNGPISGSAEFEIVKDPIQVPHANRLQFNGNEVKYRQKSNVIIADLPDELDIRVIGPHIGKSSWISNMGTLSSGQLDSDTWTWATPTSYKEVIGFLVTMENDDKVISQRKFILYDETEDE
jgi:hypothetical protein